MLETLRIRNLAVIDSAQIDFESGLTILSGETGAGKSIVLQAVSLILGSRASTDWIRSECDEAVIEGIFQIGALPWVKERLEQLGFSASDELLIKRSVHRSGKHRITINGELATLSALQQLCEGLVDLCGQHEHQSLTQATVQLDLLDRFGGLSRHVAPFASALSEARALQTLLADSESRQAQRMERIDLLRYQREELERANLQLGEDELLTREKQLLQSTETRLQLAEAARAALEEESQGAIDALQGACAKLRQLQGLDDQSGALRESLDRALAEAQDVALSLNRYLASTELDPGRLEEVQSRLSLIADFRKKYGPTLERMLERLNEIQAELTQLESGALSPEELQAKLDQAVRELTQVAQKVSSARQRVAVALSQSVTAELADLKMGEARFKIDVQPREDWKTWTASGADTVQFLIQTNRGEPERPLAKIASGGELSRVLLAVRRVIADKGRIGVYLFDEIDAGIGGQTAFQVGRKLKSVAQYNQVICITHLPQVAAFADQHWVVRKGVQGKRTFTDLVHLGKAERREELARMLAGPTLTARSLANANELLEMATEPSKAGKSAKPKKPPTASLE